MSIITSLSMFFISFFPLWLAVIFVDLLSILENTSHIWTEYISISLIISGSVLAFIVMRKTFSPKRCISAQTYILKSAKEEKAITAEFLLSYILPLFAFDFELWYEVVKFLIFFVSLAFLSIRHNHFSVNIVLDLIGYRFYNCTIKNEDNVKIEKIIVTRNSLPSYINRRITLIAINNEYSAQI